MNTLPNRFAPTGDPPQVPRGPLSQLPDAEVSELIERSESENAQVWAKITTFQPGDRVLFTPQNPVLIWAAGEKTVLAVDGGWVKLKCGDIRLVSKVSELKKI